MYDLIAQAAKTFADDIVWGLPLVILLMGGGGALLIYGGFLPFTGIARAFGLMTGRVTHEADAAAAGQITHFQALMNALAATIGLGNIAGVAVAISMGGPGAIFWMWVAALVGMNTKFFECTLAVMFRGEDYRGQTQGGPMYVIQNQLGRRFMPLAVFFAVCGLLGTTALFQVNQLSAYVAEYYPIWTEKISIAGLAFKPVRLVVGMVSAVLVTFVLLGGIRRIAHWTTAMVPTMCLLYVVCGLVIVGLNIERVGPVLAMIFRHAFGLDAAIGGASGMAVLQILRVGVQRAAFSNEAGVGTAPMAHSNAKTSEPVSEGLVAMLGPMFDTLIVCTFTALIILTAMTPEQIAGIGDSSQKAIVVTTNAFESTLGVFGRHFLGVAILLFSFSTMIGMANYNEKCWNFLFRGRYGMGEYTFITYFAATLVIGSVVKQGLVISLLDIGYGLMAVPTMVSTLLLARHVKTALRSYRQRY